jgi:hypothetical protein
VGPRAGLDAVANIKYSCHSWESISGRPDRSLVTILPELSQLLKIFFSLIKPLETRIICWGNLVQFIGLQSISLSYIVYVTLDVYI